MKPECGVAVPNIFVSDFAAAMEYYTGPLGFRTLFTYGDGPFYAHVARGAAILAIGHVTRPVLDHAAGEAVGIRPAEVSAIMGELARCNAIFTERRRVEGVRGPGQVLYFMNKHVAEYGSRATEEELSRIPKPGFAPRIIEGGQQLDLEDAITPGVTL